MVEACMLFFSDVNEKLLLVEPTTLTLLQLEKSIIANKLWMEARLILLLIDL